MIKGFLKIMVLESLKESPKSGYVLMKLIEEKTGKKPSPGSIYPLMQELKQKGFVKPKEKDRKKIYSITASGRKRIRQIQEEQKELEQKHRKLHETIDELSGKKPSKPLDFKNPDLIRNSDLLKEFKNTIEELIKKDKFKPNEQKIRKIISNTIKELKKLK